jgi:hypothetical protein
MRSRLGGPLAAVDVAMSSPMVRGDGSLPGPLYVRFRADRVARMGWSCPEQEYP